MQNRRKIYAVTAGTLRYLLPRTVFKDEKMRKHLFPANLLALILPLLALTLAGCQTHKAVIPLRNGFEEVSHPHHTLIDEPEPPRVSFQYRDADDKVTPIWPSLYGVNDVIKDDLAIFVAECGEPAERVTRARLFAVKTNDVPLDISDEVLWRWAKSNHKDFGHALTRFSGVTPAATDAGLTLQLEFISETPLLDLDKDWPDRSSIDLTWAQVNEIVRAVKTKGVRQKDPRWNAEFIGERF